MKKQKIITCYKCKKEGHYANECDEEETVKASNKKRSNFLMLTNNNQGQYSDIEEENKEQSEDNDDDTVGSSDDEYRFAFLQHDVICSIQDKVVIPKTWIFIDSQSTVDVFSNEKLQTNINDVKRNLILYFNAGKTIISKKLA